MGFIRGGLFVIVCVLFFVSLLLVNSLFTIRNSIQYDNIKAELVPVIANSLEEDANLSGIIESQMPEMEAYCENNSEYVFSEQGETFEISCDSVREGGDAVVNEAISNFVENVYYKNYDCNFWNCFTKEKGNMFFLVSLKTKNYFQGKLYLFLFISLILLALMFLLIENKTNLALITGGLIIISSLPFLKLEGFISFFTDKSYLQFFTFLFTQSYFVFLASLILGCVVLGTGLVLKFFVVGFKISGFFSKFGSSKKDKVSKKEVRGIVKEEISKQKKN